MSAELKSCAFCGAAPKTGYHGDDDGGYYYIECRVCSRPADLEVERFIGVHADNEADAITAWNRRPPASSERVALSVDQLFANDDLMALNATHGMPMSEIAKIVRVIEAAHDIKEPS